MIFLQLQTEWKQFSRGGILWLIAVFLGLAFGFAAFNGKQRLARQSAAVEKFHRDQHAKFGLLEAEADSIVSGLKEVERWWLDPTNPLVVGMLRRGGGILTVTPEPSQALATGISDLQPEAYTLVIGENRPLNSSDYDNPARLALGSFDLAFVIVYLLPLFIIAFTYNILSAEREQGTLALLLSQPVMANQVIAWKVVARFIWLSVVVVLLFVPVALWADVDMLSTGRGLAAALLYSMFWFALALAVSMLQKGSAFNALACMGGWLLFVVVVPVLVNMLSEKLYPVPSRAGYENAMREIENQMELERPAILDEYYVAHPHLQRVADEHKTPHIYWLEELHVRNIQAAHASRVREDYEQKAQSQAAFARRLIALSPGLAMYEYLTALAGTNRTAQLEIGRQLQEKETAWASWFRPKIMANEKIDASDFSDIRQLLVPIAISGQQTNYRALLWLTLHLIFMTLMVAIGIRSPISLAG